MFSSKKALLLILIFWTGSVIVIFGFIALHQMRKQSVENERDDRIGQMADEIREGSNTFLVDADSFPVSGEEDEYIGSFAEGSGKAEDPEGTGPETSSGFSSADPTTPPAYTLTSYGTVSIPSIGLELPVWDGAGVIELRYGAGRMPLSCEAGCPGNLVIFGHRMRRYGSIFNRLGEVSIGDTVTVTKNGSSFSYIVDQIVTIEPSEISYYISREDEGDACAITLITCTPIGVGTQRLLVIGHLQGS